MNQEELIERYTLLFTQRVINSVRTVYSQFALDVRKLSRLIGVPYVLDQNLSPKKDEKHVKWASYQATGFRGAGKDAEKVYKQIKALGWDHDRDWMTTGQWINDIAFVYFKSYRSRASLRQTTEFPQIGSKELDPSTEMDQAIELPIYRPHPRDLPLNLQILYWQGRGLSGLSPDPAHVIANILDPDTTSSRLERRIREDLGKRRKDIGTKVAKVVQSFINRYKVIS